MADFAAWVAAAEPALLWEPGQFMKAYTGMREDAVNLALEEDAIAQAIIRLVKDSPWEGTATELLETLEELVDAKIAAKQSWPKSPRTLANRLRRAATFLRQGADIEIEFKRQPRSGKRLIRISRKSSVTIVTSVTQQQNTLLDSASNGDARGDATAFVSSLSSPLSSPQKPSIKALGDNGDVGDDKIYASSGDHTSL